MLALAALMPDFRLLNTSPGGLALIADLEGCRLTPYQCSAGVWTSGIGHTAGVVPKGEITERQAAANLVADVLNVEKRLAVCAPVKMPPQVYDALVSFSFNVGTGAACRSTLVSFSCPVTDCTPTACRRDSKGAAQVATATYQVAESPGRLAVSGAKTSVSQG